MPTKLNAAERNAMVAQFKSTCNAMVGPCYFMNWDDVELAYLTPEQIAMAREVAKFTDQHNYSYKDIPFSVPSDLAEGITLPKFERASIEFDVQSTLAVMPSHNIPMLDNAHAAKLHDAADWLIRRAFEVGNLKLTLEWLMANCSSVEQMRYLFPPILWFLRKAGLDEIANKVEDVEKAPRLPALRPDVRWRLREVNRWWVARILLDDFDGIQAPDVSGINLNIALRATVKFDSPRLVTGGSLTMKPGEEPGYEWLFYKA